jgi:hypothetical protein
LGYGGTGGIASSIAVKFDLYNNAGEGPNSTGLYMNGSAPTIPATTLGGNVKLHSGDVFNVQITYDGTTLTMTITDANTPADTFTTSWAVNIPGTVGANTAYVGFTGGSGGETAIQDISDWTFTSGAPQEEPKLSETAFNTCVRRQDSVRDRNVVACPELFSGGTNQQCGLFCRALQGHRLAPPAGPHQ